MNITHRQARLFQIALVLFFVGVTSGLILAAGPVYSVTPGSATFSLQTVGYSGDGAEFRISNTGNADLVIGGIALSGANPGDFSYQLIPVQDRPQRSARGGIMSAPQGLPYTVSAGSYVSVIIHFLPTAAGPRSATLTIADNAPDSPHTIPLSGTANTAGVSIQPASLDFGTLTVGNTSSPLPVTITNNGSGTLVISQLAVTGANNSDFNFAVASAPPQPGRRPHRLLTLALPPTQSATVNVAFNPTSSGSRSAALSITDNVGGSPHAVPLTGSANPAAAGKLSISASHLGVNLEKLISVSVDNAPPSELPVTITSSDPSKVILSADTSGATAGSASITAPIHATANSIFPGFYIQALAAGTAQLTVSAPNYQGATANVTVGSSGFILLGPDGTGADINTFAGSTDTALTISATELDGSNNPVSTNPPARIRGGLTVNVPVNSANAAVGVIVGGPSQFTGSSSNGSPVTFHPLSAGTSLLSLGTPDVARFTTAATGAQVNAVVAPPQISLNPATVGYDLQAPGSGRLSTPAPNGGLQVTITSGDPSKVLLSTDLTGQAPGSASIIVTVPQGQGSPAGFPQFLIQAQAASGTVQLTATATGYQSGTANVALTPSGFLIDGGKGIGADFTTTPAPYSNDTHLTLTAYRLDPQLNPVAAQPLQGGIFVEVPVTSSNHSVGADPGSATFIYGNSINTDLSFHPIANGTTLLAVQQPAGFATPNSGGQLNAVVQSPAVAVNFPAAKIGRNLQVSGFGSLNAPAPTGGLQITVTSNNSNVLVSSSPTTAGSTSVVITVPVDKGVNGVGFPPFYVQSKNSATGSATITLTPPSDSGFSGASGVVTLTPGGFVLNSPNGLGQDFAVLRSGSQGSNPANIAVLSYQLNASTFLPENAESVRGGMNPVVNVTLTLDNPSVGSFNGPAAFGAGGSGSANVIFTPSATPGTSTITATAPSGFNTPNADAIIHVNVN
jgi:hypothetical protein